MSTILEDKIVSFKELETKNYGILSYHAQRAMKRKITGFLLHDFRHDGTMEAGNIVQGVAWLHGNINDGSRFV